MILNVDRNEQQASVLACTNGEVPNKSNTLLSGQTMPSKNQQDGNHHLKPPTSLLLNAEHLEQQHHMMASLSPSRISISSSPNTTATTGNKRKATDEQFVLPPSFDNQVIVPNGGYGWIVVLASFMCNLTVDGICYTFGIFLPHFTEYFDANEAVTALTGSLLSGCYMTVGVFVSCLVNRFGCRPVAMIGSILAALGFAASTQAPNVYVLMLTYGAITGSCFGLIYLPSIVSVGHYFTTKRAFATAIAVCGSGFGAFLFSPICQFLLSKYHWQESLLILSGCIAACFLYGLLMKPLPRPQIDPKASIRPGSARSKFDESRRSRSTLSVNSIRSAHSSQIRRSPRPRTWTITSQVTEMEALENGFDLKDILDVSVLKIPAMAILSLSNVFGMIGYYIPYVYIVRFAEEHLNINGNRAAWLLSAIGISNVIGRLVFGLVSDRFSGTRVLCFPRLTISALFINNVCLMFAGLTVMSMPFCLSFWSLLAASIVFGFTISSYMSLTSIILVDLLSIELLTTTFGLISCVRGLSSIIGPPLAGLLYEMTNSYIGVFISAGGLLCISSIVSFIVHRYEQLD